MSQRLEICYKYSNKNLISILFTDPNKPKPVLRPSIKENCFFTVVSCQTKASHSDWDKLDCDGDQKIKNCCDWECSKFLFQCKVPFSKAYSHFLWARKQVKKINGHGYLRVLTKIYGLKPGKLKFQEPFWIYYLPNRNSQFWSKFSGDGQDQLINPKRLPEFSQFKTIPFWQKSLRFKSFIFWLIAGVYRDQEDKQYDSDASWISIGLTLDS